MKFIHHDENGVNALTKGPDMKAHASYLKKHTEALVKDVGVENSCDVTGKSKATLGRYYSTAEEHSDRFMPVDTVAQLEAVASYPHVTSALAELGGGVLSYDETLRNDNEPTSVSGNVAELSQRFAALMSEYAEAIEDGKITVNEAKRMLREAIALQRVLIKMKLRLEEEAGT